MGKGKGKRKGVLTFADLERDAKAFIECKVRVLGSVEQVKNSSAQRPGEPLRSGLRRVALRPHGAPGRELEDDLAEAGFLRKEKRR